MNRRDFLKATAATLLGLLPWAKGRRETVAGVDLATGEDTTICYWYDDDLFIEDESGVFPGLSSYAVSAERMEQLLARCDCPFEFRVTLGSCDDAS